MVDRLQPSVIRVLARLFAGLLGVVIAASLYMLMFELSRGDSSRVRLEAEQGQLDLRTQDLGARSLLRLDGEWRYYWGQMLAPEEIDWQEKPASVVHLPASWDQHPTLAQPLPSVGYATYALSLLLPSQRVGEAMALALSDIGTSYRLFVGDRQVAQGGVPGTSAETTTGQYKPRVVLITPQSSELRITLQVANYDYYWGGIWNPILFGSAAAIYDQQQRDLMKGLFLAGALFFVAVYNLLLFMLRPRDALPLVFSVLCLVLGFRELTVGAFPMLKIYFDLSLPTQMRLDYLSFYLAVPLSLLIFVVSYPREYRRWIIVTLMAIALTFIFQVLLRPSLAYSGWLSAFQIYTAVAGLYGAWGLALAVRRRRSGAILLCSAAYFMLLLVLNDILYAMRIFETAYLSSYGLLGFIFVQAYLANLRLVRSYAKNDRLSRKIAQRNIELDQLTRSLDEKVKSRTRELEQANQALKDMAYRDPLTGILNRRGLELVVEPLRERALRQRESLSVILLDIDHFKSINDRWGHDAGDAVLVATAETIRENIRAQDALARWGGEEFLILLPDTTGGGGAALADKLRRLIADIRIADYEEIRVTATFGVAAWGEEGFSHLVSRADEALYTGKEAGRNQVQIAKDEPVEDAALNSSTAPVGKRS